MISLKVKTLDSQTYDFTVDEEITVRQFKDTVAEKTNISADLQRIIYCGRVLADEKQLKEYYVDGKVVHVVERAPPNLRSGGNSGATRNRRENDTPDPNLRASQIFRALDGMVIGAMTVPVNPNAGPPPQPIVNPSSSFCMNRITVARHMLECANNIALYLENPERGLHNSPLDILTLGRFTMESTVVEVGISADARTDPQNQTQNLVEALNSAVNAAFRQSGNPNFTVTQLPTVFRVNGSPASQQATDAENSEMGNAPEEMRTSNEINSPTTNNTANTATASTETNSESNGTPQAQPDRNGASNGPNGQTTCTRVLADVYNEMRTVQARLDPFYQQYQEILMNDPTFEENDAAGRENSQRIYDRVSEAMHYMAHAQHAMSDLMLDLSQPAPRHLCCRPILVEQSGYVSSNNYLTSFLEPNGNNNESSMANNNASSNVPPTPAQSFTMPTVLSHPTPLATATTTTTSAESNQPTTQTTATTQSQTTPTTGQGQSQTQPQQPQQQVNVRDLRRILSQILQPAQIRYAGYPTIVTPPPRPSTVTASNTENDNQANPQMQVARLIQAVVNSAPLHADVHVQINAPNILQYGIPIPTPPPTSQTPVNTPPANGPATTTETNSAENQPRVTTATHPTTSTQTRSTARPQVHISNLPPPQMWNARVIPTNMVSSFDRFLPCSSHHIRETEQTENNHPPPHIPTIYTRNRLGQMRQARRTPAGENSSVGSPLRTAATATRANPPSSASSTSSNDARGILHLSNEDFSTPINLFGINLTLRDIINIVPNPFILNRIRDELRMFIVENLFAGAPITDENMNDAISRVIQMLNSFLVFLPQFDLPDYDARASVENFLRNILPFIINLVGEDESSEFGTRLVRELMSFVRRIFVILVTCIGRSNAELYLNQVAQMTITSNNPIEQEALRALHRYLMTAAIRELDMTRQNTSEVQEFLVIRRPPPESNNTVTLMETDETPLEQSQAATSATSSMHTTHSEMETALPLPTPIPDSTEPLPAVVAGSEPWHSNFPSHWLPIITRDIDRQRRQSPQGPFSDAYISGMSAKRRKLVTNSRPPTDVNALLSDGVRRALQTVGVSSTSSSTSVDEVTSVISSHPSVQLSYRESLRSNIQERLKTEPDFNPDKFPNSSKYFHK